MLAVMTTAPDAPSTTDPAASAAPASGETETTDARVAIVGLGYVGLPLALSFVEAGLEVVGVDATIARVEELRDGHSPIDDVDDARLRDALGRGFSVQGTEDAELQAADVVVVCVPTPINEAKEPDLGA